MKFNFGILSEIEYYNDFTFRKIDILYQEPPSRASLMGRVKGRFGSGAICSGGVVNVLTPVGGWASCVMAGFSSNS